MRIFVSTGEPSGDHHAANLVHALKAREPGVEVVGFGGPRFEAAGGKLLFPLVDLAVMWFLRVLLNYHKFVAVANQAERYFREQKPDAVVLIDYPGFHWHIARRAKKYGIPVVYYVPPQLWAWAGWRVKKIKRSFDRLLCSLPFEPEWYAKRGVNFAEYVGHPFFDELAERTLDAAFLSQQRQKGVPIVAILPGSRGQEIERNAPLLLKAAAEVAAKRPGTRFLVACHKPAHAERITAMMAAKGLTIPNLELHQGRTPEIMRLATLALSVSGSVSLELMAEALPTVILYKIRPIDLFIARPFIRAKYITLVNLLADEPVMPEYLTDRDVSSELAGWALKWLNDPEARAERVERLAALRNRVARPGAAGRAAERIVALVAERRAAAKLLPALRGPHAKAAETAPRRV
jgi:lipid-A-disaccharide synthase